MSQKAYSCRDCGTVNVFESHIIDGIRCIECGGDLVLMGEIVNPKNRTKGITMKINIDTTELDMAMKKTEVLYKQISEVQAKLSNPYLVQEFEAAEEQPEIIKKFQRDVIDALRYGAEVLAKSR